MTRGNDLGMKMEKDTETVEAQSLYTMRASTAEPLHLAREHQRNVVRLFAAADPCVERSHHLG